MNVKFTGVRLCAGSPTSGSEGAFDALCESGVLAELGGEAAEYEQITPTAEESEQDPALRHLEPVMECARGLYRASAEALANGLFPFAVGGDHSIAMGSAAASGDRYGAQNVSLLWIDAHTDINNERSSETGFIHGMPVAALLGLCSERLDLGERKPHLYGENVFIVGARSIDDGEYPLIAESGVHLYTMEEIRRRSLGEVMREIAGLIKTPYLHVSFDVDSLDPTVFSSTGYLILGGLTFSEVGCVIDAAAKAAEVVSFDLVEYNPRLDTEGKDLGSLRELLLRSVRPLLLGKRK